MNLNLNKIITNDKWPDCEHIKNALKYKTEMADILES